MSVSLSALNREPASPCGMLLAIICNAFAIAIECFSAMALIYCLSFGCKYCFLNYLTISIISSSVISYSNKASSSDCIYFGPFSSTLFISGGSNFATRNLVLVSGYHVPGRL